MHSNDIMVRLRRRGHHSYSVYEVVVSYKWKRRQSDYFEKLGFYNPQYREKVFFIDLYRLGFWLNRGAKLHSA